MPNETEITPRKPRLEGRLDAYVPGDSFEDYLVQVEIYFDLNKLEDEERKVKLLLNLIGPAASTKVIKSFKPDKYTDKSYNEIITQCKKLFVGELNTIVERFKFNSRQQNEGESIDDFAVDLQSLAENCNFNKFVDEALRDRFVVGLKDSEIKKELLGMKSDSKFKLVVERAKREELTRREAKSMSSDPNTTEKVNRVEARSRVKPSEQKGDNASWRSRSRSPSAERVKCFNCNEWGHFARFCNNRRAPRLTNRQPRNTRGYGERRNTNAVTDDMMDEFENLSLDEDPSELHDFNALNSIVLGKIHSVKTALVNVAVDSTSLTMELDTGSCVSVCDFETYNRLFSNKVIVSNKMPLSVVSGEKLEVLGSVNVRVTTKTGEFELPLTIIKTRKRFTPLLGRNWLEVLCPSWRAKLTINSIDSPKEIELVRAKMLKGLKTKFPSLFDNDLTKPIKEFVVDIRMNHAFRPFVHKPYTVPFHLRERVSVQLDQLERAGILEKIEYAECASPMVVVAKANKDLRICFDGSVTINPYIETHHYPLPVIDELLANKSGANLFCVLDLKGAYQQLIVNDKTKRVLAVNTIKGLYAFRRLPFGVKPAASIFQSVIDKILEGLRKVQAYIDDILIWGRTAEELYANLLEVLKRLEHYNVKLNPDKCQWFVNKVTYLGHVVSATGIAPNQEKVKAIIDAPAPQNVSQLKALLGMIQYYSKFLPKLNMKFSPLYELLKKDVAWEWNEKCNTAFKACKKLLSSSQLLMHYDPNLPMVITCDASNDGIAGVLSHRVNGVERPVMYVSRALKPAEKNYPILHREALAIVFTLEKFYKYVYGHPVEIFTDHKPLEGIFMGKKGAPAVVASRLQRYVWRISHFDYTLRYKKGIDNGNADCLSRLPLQETLSDADEREIRCDSITSKSNNSGFMITMNELREATDNDECLSKIRDYVMNGWSCDRDKKSFRAYYICCLTYDDRVIVPKACQNRVLKLLHANHAGIVRMKRMARQQIFWEGLNRDVETYVGECESCQMLRKDKPVKDYGTWSETSFPFERIHLDFFHFQGQTFLILIDAHTRWLEIKRMGRTNAQMLIHALMPVFQIFGLPKEIVTDNGPPFSSYEFKKFCDENIITKTHTPPYHPASNGLVERAVQTTKSVLRKFMLDNPDNFQLDRSISKFLMNYRNSPHTDNEITPARQILNYKPRSPLSVLTEDNKKQPRVAFLELTSVTNADNRINELKLKASTKFSPKENVLYITKQNGYCHSVRAQILKKMSNTVYMITIGNSVRLAHINQLRKSILKPVIFPNIPNIHPEIPNQERERRPRQRTPALSQEIHARTASAPPATKPKAESSSSNSEEDTFCSAEEDEVFAGSLGDLPIALRKPQRARTKTDRYIPSPIKPRRR